MEQRQGPSATVLFGSRPLGMQVLRGCSVAEGVSAQSPRHGNELIRD